MANTLWKFFLHNHSPYSEIHTKKAKVENIDKC